MGNENKDGLGGNPVDNIKDDDVGQVEPTGAPVDKDVDNVTDSSEEQAGGVPDPVKVEPSQDRDGSSEPVPEKVSADAKFESQDEGRVSYEVEVGLRTVVDLMKLKYGRNLPKGLKIYENSQRFLTVVQRFLVASVIAGIASELFTGTIKTGFTISSYLLLILFIVGVAHTILQTYLVDMKMHKAFSGEDKRNTFLVSVASWVLGTIGVLGYAAVMLNVIASDWFAWGTLVDDGGHILHDYSMLSEGSSGALIQSMPFSFLGLAVGVGIVGAVYYLVKRNSMLEELSKDSDFVTLYRSGKAAISE